MRHADLVLERAIERLIDSGGAAPEGAVAAELIVAHPRELEALRVIADVAAGCRRVQDAGEPAPPALFAWGHLQVRAQVASGASADVYRAFDPALGIDVALKLHRAAPDSPPATRFLDEARHLARVRQRNVVGIYGAAVHGGRAGLWCEWIDGSSLAAQLAGGGALAPVEAAYVGIELCAALAALHGAGLLHGDLKPANVLRERGGRIVLVDLGAGGTPQTVNAASADYGTPAYLPPEVLAGTPRAPAHDLYALGRLLHALLAGAADAALPDTMPAALRGVLARATAHDPSQRYERASELRDALAGALAASGGAFAATSRRRRPPAAAAAAVVVVVLLLAFVVAPRWFAAAPWRTHVELLRHADAADVALADGARIARGDRLVLELESSRPAYAYVLNEDAAGALHVLFPLPGLAANPLPAAARVRLPGRQGARELSWEVTSDGADEEFLVVLADAPLAPLEAAARAAAIPVEGVERGVGRVHAELPNTQALRGTHLNALLRQLQPILADPERAQLRTFRFNESASADHGAGETRRE